MDQELSRTLNELERKLAELERTVHAIGAGEEPPRNGEDEPGARGQLARAEPPASVGASRIVDETLEQAQPGSTPASARVEPPAGAPWPPRAPQPPSDATQAGRASQPPEAMERTSQASSATDRAPRATGAAELLRFRERLEHAAHELTHDYDELLGRLSYAAVPSATGPTISFARGAPSLDIVDVDGLRDAAVRAFESDPAGTTAYGTSIGYPRLRSWIADRHGVEPERVLVTNGSMQADAFLFEQLVKQATR